jgi:hypothetical protein
MLQGFALYMSDDAGTSFNEIDASLVRSKPEYTIHTTLVPSAAGSAYMFKIEAYNVNGNTFSEPVSFVLADTPAAPLNAPTSDLSVSSDSQLKIDIALCYADGNSPILSYSLEIDDG